MRSEDGKGSAGTAFSGLTGIERMGRTIADDVNTLAAFCGPRDINELSREEVLRVTGSSQADVMVLFGGSILAGGDVLAEAMRSGIARRYIIVGGAGHTTQTLRDKMHAQFPDIETDGLPEAVIFNAYLKKKYALEADCLETASTNCGNNITNLLELIMKERIECRSVILCQDAAMQRRMSATLRKYDPEMKIINYAAYAATVGADLAYTQDIYGMWDFDRYLSLLMGEIPRLTDNADGYGPLGKGFIAHEDIPEEVQGAFDRLRKQFGGIVREANPAYAGLTKAE